RGTGGPGGMPQQMVSAAAPKSAPMVGGSRAMSPPPAQAYRARMGRDMSGAPKDAFDDEEPTGASLAEGSIKLEAGDYSESPGGAEEGGEGPPAPPVPSTPARRQEPDEKTRAPEFAKKGKVPAPAKPAGIVDDKRSKGPMREEKRSAARTLRARVRLVD